MSSEEPPFKKPKQKRRYTQTEKRKTQQAKYLKPWPKGQPNTCGRPKQHAEVVATIRDNAEEILGTLFRLMRKDRLSPGDKTRYMVCEALLDRGFGRAPHTLAAAIQHHTGLDGTALHLEGAAMSPLLQAAHAHIAEEAKQLPPPDAVKAIDVTPEPISSQPLPDVIPMTPPAPAVKEPGPSVVVVDPVPENPKKPEPAPPAPEAPKAKPPFSGIPADGAAYMAFRERACQEEVERKRQHEAARADPSRYPGGQIPMSELQPDKVNIDQGPMEILRFGRVPGGRGIRRIT